MLPGWRSSWGPWWVVLVAMFAMGCARGRMIKKAGGVQYRITDVTIEGNETLKDKEIEPHLNLRETTWFPLPERQFFFPGMVPIDRDRIEELYASNGFYDAQVLDVKLDRDVDAKTIGITFVVDEGEPTLVKDLDFRWPKGPPAGPEDPKARPEEVQTACGLKPGMRFEVSELEGSEAAMEETLRGRGYAFAEVTADARVDRVAREATVVYELFPGPFVRIGDIDIQGLDMVPEELVINEVDGFIGRPFAPWRLDYIEDAIYGMEVFSSVVVTHDEEPENGTVDVHVKVAEGDPQSVELGVGLSVEANRWEQWGEARYSHRNLFGNLTRLDLRMRIGYAQLPLLWDPQQHGPVFLLEPRLEKKGFLEENLVWTAVPSFEVGIQEGYQYYSPRTRLGVSRFFTRFFELGLTHNFRFVDFFNIDPAIDESDSILGLDFQDPYTISFLELQSNVYLTDRLINPRNGVVLSNIYQFAGGFLGGTFSYQKVIPEARAYYTPIENRLQFAGRGRVGVLMPSYVEDSDAPFDQRFYLGGNGTVRGFEFRRLSPFVEDCDDGDCSRVPIGGRSMVLANFETRVRVWKELWAVAFVDAGDVQLERYEYRHPREWSYSVGPGLRYDTPVGIIRLDVGVILTDDPRFAAERRWAIHFGLGETF